MSRQCDTRTQYQFGCGISKMVGPKKQDFGPRINILEGFFFENSIDECQLVKNWA